MRRRLLIVIALFVASVSQAAAAAERDVVSDWNNVALDCIRAAKAPPPVATRALAMVHVAMYDVLAATDDAYPALQFTTTAEPNTSLEAALSQATYRVLLNLFPKQDERLTEALAGRLTEIPDGKPKSAGIELGDSVAIGIVAWRIRDGADDKAEYYPSLRIGRWAPTPPNFAAAVLPQWGRLTPFVIDDPIEFRTPKPPELTSERYTKDWKEVHDLGSRDSLTRTDEQTEIAKVWEGPPGSATPPGYWNQIAQIVAADRKLTTAQQVRLFAVLNVTLADAAIVCWESKYHYDCWRPITAIRQADTDGNPATKKDPKWQSLLDTPAFPSCSSGHSTFSAAAAELLALYFDDEEIAFSFASDTGGEPRKFRSLAEAAEEAGRSRIYGGIHFQFDNEYGLATGRALAQHVFRKAFPKQKGEPVLLDSGWRAKAQSQSTPAPRTIVARPPSGAPTTAATIIGDCGCQSLLPIAPATVTTVYYLPSPPVQVVQPYCLAPVIWQLGP